MGVEQRAEGWEGCYITIYNPLSVMATWISSGVPIMKGAHSVCIDISVLLMQLAVDCYIRLSEWCNMLNNRNQTDCKVLNYVEDVLVETSRLKGICCYFNHKTNITVSGGGGGGTHCQIDAQSESSEC